MPDQDATLLRPSFFRTLFFVVIAGMALVLIDSVLASTERRETALAAARFYSDGQQLIQQHRYTDAADAFRSAIANARANTEYPLALGEALLAAGQLDEASATLTDLLAASSMAGAPNLAMARVYTNEGQFEEAAFYYHRAIYGQWPQDAVAASQVKARFELADLLASRNSKAELLAELLPLQDEAPRDPATQEKLGRLFLIAGSSARAAATFRDLAHIGPDNPAAQEGLGEAEMASGDCAAARSAFNTALRLRPEDQHARKSLDVCEQVLSLDPLRRGIDAQERYHRSVRLLRAVTDRVNRCHPGTTGISDLTDAAHAALARKLRPAEQNEAVESNVDLAGKVWQTEQSECHLATASGDEALEMVLARAAR
jgi:tetratricopeptide (TPR) repeat protein